MSSIEASCHCGDVRLVCEVAPVEVTACNCSICRRYGALWAYYSPTRVRLFGVEAGTDIYMWGDRAGRFHRCRKCGCVTHWSAVDESVDRMGVNARLMPLAIVGRARVRFRDGADTGRYLNEP